MPISQLDKDRLEVLQLRETLVLFITLLETQKITQESYTAHLFININKTF